MLLHFLKDQPDIPLMTPFQFLLKVSAAGFLLAHPEDVALDVLQAGAVKGVAYRDQVRLLLRVEYKIED